MLYLELVQFGDEMSVIFRRTAVEKNPAAHTNVIYSCIEKQMQVIGGNPTVCGYYLVLKDCPGFPDFVQDLGSERAAVRTRIDGQEKYRADVLRYASEFLYRSFRFDGQSGTRCPVLSSDE